MANIILVDAMVTQNGAYDSANENMSANIY